MKTKTKLKGIMAVLLGTALGIGVTIAYAVDGDGHFELGDGLGTSGSADILGDGLQPGPDWADIFDANGNVVNLFGGAGAAFSQDDLSLKGAVDDTIFASSNKNNDLINTWQWDSGNTPAKDEISTSYVYAKIVSGNLRIYGGLERVDDNGDAHVDIEFNQNAVGLDKEPPCADDGTGGAGDGSPCEFQGVREVNDFVVSMDFEKGGGLGIVRVFVWDGATFNQVTDVAGEGCNPAHSVCAFNNGAPIDGGPWPNFAKGTNGPVTMIDTNGFTEFGVDVPSVLGSDASVCFATVNFKTRTSQSFTSELKDFSVHAFEECIATVTTEVNTNPGDVKVADDYSMPTPYTSSVPVGTVVDDTATVAGLPGLAPNGSVNFYLYNTIDCSDTPALFDTADLPLGDDSTKSATSNTLSLDTPGSYGFVAEYSGDTNYPAATSGCEAFTVLKVNSSVNTKVVTNPGESETEVTNTALDLGTTVYDKAIVMGANSVDPTGDVTFRRWTNADCTGSFSDETQTLADDSIDDGIAAAYSNAVDLNAEGFLCWEVFYQGDAYYNTSASTVGEPICAFDFSPDLTP